MILPQDNVVPQQIDFYVSRHGQGVTRPFLTQQGLDFDLDIEAAGVAGVKRVFCQGVLVVSSQIKGHTVEGQNLGVTFQSTYTCVCKMHDE